MQVKELRALDYTPASPPMNRALPIRSRRYMGNECINAHLWLLDIGKMLILPTLAVADSISQ